MNTKLPNILTYLVTSIFFALISVSSYASEPVNYFNQIVYFGDSLSDNGNLYWADFGFLPKSPPYFDGRFSNGNVWSEHVADFYKEQNSIEAHNYAVGGLTSLFHSPIHGFLPYSLNLSLNTYLVRTAFRDRAHTLFVIWIGANDYFPGTTDPDALTTSVVANIQYAVERLISHGGLNFLIINLPDLAKTPFAKNNDVTALMSNLTVTHNQKLTAMLEELQNSYKGINLHLFDVNRLFDDLITNTQFYNEKYNTHLTNTTESCWSGGYTLRTARNVSTQDKVAVITRQLQEQISLRTRTTKTEFLPAKNLDVGGFAQYIATTPALLESYTLGAEAGTGNTTECSNPDEYIFWDHIHPTKIVHTMLSKGVIDYINGNYTPLGLPAGK